MDDIVLILLIIFLFIVVIGCIIRSTSHHKTESKFDVSVLDLVSIVIEGDHYLIYFDASKFPVCSDDASNTFFTYTPRVEIKKTGRVTKDDEIATVKIIKISSFSAPSTGRYNSESVFKEYPIKSPYDGVVHPRYSFNSQMTKFVICELKPGIDTEEKTENETIFKKYGISEQYNKDTVAICEKIRNFKKSLGLNLSAIEAISNACVWIDNKKDEHITHLIVMDALRCFEGFGTAVALDSKEGFGFMVLIWGLISDEPFPEYKNIENYYKVASTTADYIQSIKVFANEAFESKRLTLPYILSSCDSGIRDKYLVLLSQWASIVASADKKVTTQEKEWIEKLTNIQDEAINTICTITVDDKFIEVAKHVVTIQKASITEIQRVFSIGFSRASRIITQLESVGIIGTANGASLHPVNVSSLDELNNLLSGIELNYGKTATTVIEENIVPITAKRASKSQVKSNPIKELDNMIGLGSVKEEVKTLYNFVKVQKMREDRGMKTSSVSYHCVFTGNPGTGKTTVARIVAEIYRDLGILKKGHLVETDRSGLVAEYVGQTAVKTNKIIDSALDGVLFIDEAYSLSEGGQGDFGREAIATLLKRMEDNRDRLVVILAGYSSNMKGFIDTNPGLQSRFNRYINFPDYTASELYDIFLSCVKKNEYTLSEDAETKLKDVLSKAVDEKDESFGNGRFVRNLFEKTIQHQANRISQKKDVTLDILSQITEEDIEV